MPPTAAHSDEYREATRACGWAVPEGRGFLRVSGPERTSYLQGMVTNDVEALAEGAGCLAAVLTPKGAMVGLLRVLRRSEDLLLDVADGRALAVKAFLQRYLISEDAELHDAPEFALVSLVGPAAAEALALLPAQARVGTLDGQLGPGLDVVVQREALAAVEAALVGVPRLSPETLEVLRVESGLPKFGAELGETTIPLEANLERAIHYQKGCYIGQEVIARATYRGQMNKRLMGLLVGAGEVDVGAELRVGERKVGWVTSVAVSERKGQTVALGYLHRDFLAPGTQVTTPAGAALSVVPLPFA